MKKKKLFAAVISISAAVVIGFSIAIQDATVGLFSKPVALPQDEKIIQPDKDIVEPVFSESREKSDDSTVKTFYAFRNEGEVTPARRHAKPFYELIEPVEPVIMETPKGCVFKTVFEGEDIDSAFIYKTTQNIEVSMKKGLSWMSTAQLSNGGWGAGSSSRQREFDPHAVNADPATTAIVGMALLRCGNTPFSGTYASNLDKATEYLLTQVENSKEDELNITSEKGTQPQIKLGSNIDVVLTSQFLTNLIDHLAGNQAKLARVKKCIDVCVTKIQRAQDGNGSQSGAGWAGVLQSSFAYNALETAESKGIKIDSVAVQKSVDYQKKNYDKDKKSVVTKDAAGVMLYSVSGTARASSKEARVAKERISKAKREGKVKENETVSVESLRKAGMNDADAMKYGTAYEINEAAKMQARSDRVMEGFGSNGGEEFLSYLQTGEGMIISKDIEWKKWYDNVSGKLISIQGSDGSWTGHHCITSPVFCTATSLLILSINNDVKQLIAMGGK